MNDHLNLKNTAVALDIGTTKVCAVIAEKISDQNKIDILAFGVAPFNPIALVC